MPLIGEISGLHQTFGELCMEWPISDFFSLSEEVDSFYQSPVFNFSDSSWLLKLYPNGQTKDNTSGWVGLYLERKDLRGSKTVDFLLAVKKLNGYEQTIFGHTCRFHGAKSHGNTFMLRSELQRQMSQWMLSNVLTVICRLKSYERHNVEVSLFNILWNVSRNMKAVLDGGKETSFTFKLKGREVRAHKMILQSKCPYFAGMIEFDSQQNATGEANIDDIEGDVFQCVLCYLYCGEAEGVSIENVCKIYVTADKLLLEELKKLCIEYMKENLCPDLVCGVVEIAEIYEEKELKERALKYFNRHAYSVFATDEWKEFKGENPTLAAELVNIAEDYRQNLEKIRVPI